MLARAVSARRALEIGTGAGASGLEIATALPDDGLLITLERDAATATAARQCFEERRLGARVSVMVGDAARYLHKIAGPFDVIVVDIDAASALTLHDRLVALLAPSALLVAHVSGDAADYNRMLAEDARLSTSLLPIGNGVAIAVKRQV